MQATRCGHPIQLCVCASNYEEAPINVRYRVEPSQAERSELTLLLNTAGVTTAKMGRAYPIERVIIHVQWY